jgi:ATP citrate (pro-S)-lyase
MPRKKISEYSAKTILYQALGTTYTGLSLGTSNSNDVNSLDLNQKYVVKVDQGVKGRFKRGLVKLDRSPKDISADVAEFTSKGYDSMLVEPEFSHLPESERYLAFERQRIGIIMSWSETGGVNVEQQASSIRRAPYTPEVAERAAQALGTTVEFLETLVNTFNDNYFSFLEINPLVVVDNVAWMLDAAVEVDSEAAFFVDGRWKSEDFRSFSSAKKPAQVEAVETLASQSQASFSLSVLNPNGSIFLLLSGGGASVVLADEVFNQGAGGELGNYGEYSGNPNTEETQVYTRQILSLMLESKADKKVLVIAGGVANFTDVRATFKGVIAALDEAKTELRAQGILVYVRRGGPFEIEGLKNMHDFLDREGLLGEVSGPELMLSGIIPRAMAGLEVIR